MSVSGNGGGGEAGTGARGNNHHPLSKDLAGLLAHADGRSLSVGEIERALKGRGLDLMIALLTLPFVIPAIPGLSVPFGVAIMLMGLRIACGQRPWVPGFILDKRVPYKVLERVVKLAIWALSKLEGIIKPRMHFLRRWPGMINLIGAGICSGGLLLALPLPIPATNTLPALSILCLTVGMMERDGVLVIAGHVLALASWAYLGLWILLGHAGASGLWNYFG